MPERFRSPVLCDIWFTASCGGRVGYSKRALHGLASPHISGLLAAGGPALKEISEPSCDCEGLYILFDTLDRARAPMFSAPAPAGMLEAIQCAAKWGLADVAHHLASQLIFYSGRLTYRVLGQIRAAGSSRRYYDQALFQFCASGQHMDASAGAADVQRVLVDLIGAISADRAASEAFMALRLKAAARAEGR